MSSASRSKSKDKRAAGKEPQKSSTKITLNSNTGGGVPASGYNPLLGTFHTLDTAPISSALSLHLNSRSRNFDESEDQSGNFVGIGAEYDSLSNNGSWSGESEDHKEKPSQGSSRQETIPGVDNDKREKIRQKNEKKHQRQKERRAQELRERCSGYLMSRKLEALAQQLVAMGFSSERATMALILNEGRVEQSVAWLFEGGGDAANQREHHLDEGANLKIDISEELAQITEMEIKFKCSKQEVERAIVACEGDLEQAAETLNVLKQEPPAVPLKHEETNDSATIGKSNSNLSLAMGHDSLTSRTQSKHTTSAGPIPIQKKTDDRDLNYTKMAVMVGPRGEPGIKSLQVLKRVPPNLEWTKQQQIGTPSIEKRWPVGGSNPSLSYSLASPFQSSPPPAETESRLTTIGIDLKNLQLGSVREPVMVMQRPQLKHIPASVSSSSSSISIAGWHPNVVEPAMNMNPNGFSHVPTSTRSFSTQSYGNNVNTQLYDHFHYHQQQSLPQQRYTSSNGPVDHHFSQHGSMHHFSNGGMWNQTPGPTLAAASSLGLFSGLGSNGSSGPSSPIDWNVGDQLQFDYTNIDWSLDRLPNSSSTSSRPGLQMGWGSSTNAADLYSFGRSGKTAMKPSAHILSNGNNGFPMGLHPNGVGAVGSEASGEWISPFEEKELFSLPRQFVSAPSL